MLTTEVPCALEAVRRNILEYSQINMMHGVLRNVDDGGAWLAPDELARHVYAPASLLADGEVFEAQYAGLSGLALEQLVAFDRAYQLDNRIALCIAVTGVAPGPATAKSRFIAALNRIQQSTIPQTRDQIVVSFADDAETRHCLQREGLLTDGQHPWIEDAAERFRTFGAVRDAMEFIRAVDGPLHDLIVETIGSLVCFRRPGKSGSVSSLVGFMWLNPSSEWSVVDYAEYIVHEYIHNAIFVADLSRKIFAKPHYEMSPDSLIVTAILKYPRNFNIAFHSLFVAVSLGAFLRRANQPARARQVLSGAALTLGEISKKPELLSEHGAKWLSQLHEAIQAVCPQDGTAATSALA
ncbi:MAG TPA: HEXXH motif-containing putative peptide modification protein [Phenylobacterium sp.]|jgi:hypothetical protein|nr:HEXXH motif-containing putative peptide modification protein [Phenylobacterium sp.]